jgi:hypothetical protein
MEQKRQIELFTHKYRKFVNIQDVKSHKKRSIIA